MENTCSKSEMEFQLTIAFELSDPDIEFSSCWHFSKWLFRSLTFQNVTRITVSIIRGNDGIIDLREEKKKVKSIIIPMRPIVDL